MVTNKLPGWVILNKLWRWNIAYKTGNSVPLWLLFKSDKSSDWKWNSDQTVNFWRNYAGFLTNKVFVTLPDMLLKQQRLNTEMFWNHVKCFHLIWEITKDIQAGYGPTILKTKPLWRPLRQTISGVQSPLLPGLTWESRHLLPVRVRKLNAIHIFYFVLYYKAEI